MAFSQILRVIQDHPAPPPAPPPPQSNDDDDDNHDIITGLAGFEFPEYVQRAASPTHQAKMRKRRVVLSEPPRTQRRLALDADNNLAIGEPTDPRRPIGAARTEPAARADDELTSRPGVTVADVGLLLSRMPRETLLKLVDQPRAMLTHAGAGSSEMTALESRIRTLRGQHDTTARWAQRLSVWAGPEVTDKGLTQQWTDTMHRPYHLLAFQLSEHMFALCLLENGTLLGHFYIQSVETHLLDGVGT